MTVCVECARFKPHVPDMSSDQQQAPQLDSQTLTAATDTIPSTEGEISFDL